MSDDRLRQLLEETVVASQGHLNILQVLGRIVIPPGVFDANQAAWEIEVECREFHGVHGWFWQDNLTGNLWDLWNLMVEVMECVPRNHLAQDRMIATMRALEQLNGEHQREVTIRGKTCNLWADFPLMETCLTNVPRAPSLMDRPEDTKRAWKWINLNAFTAKVWGEALMKADSWLDLPVGRMRQALEESGHTQREMRMHLFVVREWIDHAGIAIYLSMNEELTSDQMLAIRRCGDLFTGLPTCALDRWEFWKGRLVEMRTDVPEEMSAMALAIVQRMVQIEYYVNTMFKPEEVEE